MSALFIAVVAALTAQAPSDVPLEPGAGAPHHRITTANPVAQQHFDQGLRFVYASNYGEAVHSFRTARRIDPTCAMCYWGEALALGPTVDGPMTAANDSAAQTAIGKAMLHARRVSSHERAYVRALARRYGPDSRATRAQRDTAYAKAMGEIVRAFPEDPDAAVLHAEAQLLVSRRARGGEPPTKNPNLRSAGRRWSVPRNTLAATDL